MGGEYRLETRNTDAETTSSFSLDRDRLCGLERTASPSDPRFIGKEGLWKSINRVISYINNGYSLYYI